MILERTAAYVLVIVCVFQSLLPSWTIKPHRWRSIDLQIGRLRVQARDDADSAARMPLLGSWQKEPKRLQICISDKGCITAWLDRASYAWMISADESEMLDSGD